MQSHIRICSWIVLTQMDDAVQGRLSVTGKVTIVFSNSTVANSISFLVFYHVSESISNCATKELEF